MMTTNVAAFKSVTMSSEYNPPSHAPFYAVDDQIYDTVYALKCASTLNDVIPWMVVDLENSYDVNYITLFNTVYMSGERLRNVSVVLGEKPGSFPVRCGSYGGPGENGEVIHIVCDKPARGQFIKIQMDNTQQEFILSLCEIRVLV